MLSKTVTIGDREVTFRSSAAIPRMYRIKFKRDIFKDLSKLEKSYKDKGGEDGSTMEIEDLEIFENVAYIMALHADPTIPKTIEDWLDQFEMFSIYEILPEILELWGSNGKDEGGGKFTFEPEKARAFSDAIQEYSIIEHEVDVFQVSEDVFCGGGLTTREMYTLDWMVKGEA